MILLRASPKSFAPHTNGTLKFLLLIWYTSSAGDNIAINLGTDIYFINTKGWLKKKYSANEEIRNIIVSDRIAAIVFRDKIEILVL